MADAKNPLASLALTAAIGAAGGAAGGAAMAPDAKCACLPIPAEVIDVARSLPPTEVIPSDGLRARWSIGDAGTPIRDASPALDAHNLSIDAALPTKGP